MWGKSGLRCYASSIQAMQHYANNIFPSSLAWETVQSGCRQTSKGKALIAIFGISGPSVLLSFLFITGKHVSRNQAAQEVQKYTDVYYSKRVIYILHTSQNLPHSVMLWVMNKAQNQREFFVLL